MLLIALAAATQLVGPSPADALTLFSPEDMPGYVQSAGINRLISTRTTIRPDGTAQDCVLERSGGDRNLDSLTCAIILKRARFQPAKWVDGSPVYAILRTGVSWSFGGPASKGEIQKAYPADMDISLSRLPPKAENPTKVRLNIAVDEKGRVIGCSEAPPVSKGDHEKIFPELVSIACQQLTSEYTAIPAMDASGKPVRSVQSATVGFTTKL